MIQCATTTDLAISDSAQSRASRWSAQLFKIPSRHETAAVSKLPKERAVDEHHTPSRKLLQLEFKEVLDQQQRCGIGHTPPSAVTTPFTCNETRASHAR